MPTAPLPRIYSYMPDDVLDGAIAELERTVSQDAFACAPPRERAAYLDAYGAALAEAERRGTV